MTRFFRSVPLLAALSCLLLIAGCSALRLSYSQADTLIAWRANEYFDLNPLQRDDLNARLERLHAWHRYEQLPDYAVFASTAIAKARQGLKHDDVVWFIEGLKGRYRVIVNRGSTDAAEMLATLAPEQIDALQTKWHKVNRKFAREHDGGSVEKHKRARLKDAGPDQDWTGGLTTSRNKNRGAAGRHPLIEHLRHADRIRRQQKFLQLLKLRTTRSNSGPNCRHGWWTGRAAAHRVPRCRSNSIKRIEFILRSILLTASARSCCIACGIRRRFSCAGRKAAARRS